MPDSTQITSVSLVFDDGFIDSCLKICDLFESKRLKANFAVLVNDHEFMPHIPKGDFNLWNKLQEHGHTIHPHGYDHTDLTQIPFTQATQKIDDCLNHFASHLSGFKANKTCYHLTYNRSTPEIDNYLLTQVRAIRTTGPDGQAGSGMNNQTAIDSRIYSCAWHGPEECGQHLMTTLQRAKKERPKQMTYMLHGVDGEGWGPIALDDLSRSLDYILSSPTLNYSVFPNTL